LYAHDVNNGLNWYFIIIIVPFYYDGIQCCKLTVGYPDLEQEDDSCMTKVHSTRMLHIVNNYWQFLTCPNNDSCPEHVHKSKWGLAPPKNLYRFTAQKGLWQKNVKKLCLPQDLFFY